MRRTAAHRAATLGVVVLLAAVAVGGSETVGAAVPTNYVALGDSYTAGPVIPNAVPDPLGCLRSDHNYPHFIAQLLAVPTFRDASCAGATTTDMTSPQNVSPGPNPAQFDRLDPATQLVTVQIGGNDIGFTDIFKTCVTANPNGTPCQDLYVMGPNDQITNRITATAPKVAAVLQGIHAHSPFAQVLLVAYLDILPETGPGCWPTLPFAYADVPYLRDKEKELNATLAQQAAANNATYVDAYTPSIGHDACQPPCRRWVEPLVPAALAAPVHPNLTGMIATAAIVLRTPPPASPTVCPIPASPRFTG